MAKGLLLHAIAAGAGDVYVSNSARFDFTGLRDPLLPAEPRHRAGNGYWDAIGISGPSRQIALVLEEP